MASIGQVAGSSSSGASHASGGGVIRASMTRRFVQPAGVSFRPNGQSQRRSGCAATVARDIWHAAELAGVIAPGEPLPEVFTDEQVKLMLAVAPGAGGEPAYSSLLPQRQVAQLLGVGRDMVRRLEQRALGKLRSDAELVAAMGDVAVERARSGGGDA